MTLERFLVRLAKVAEDRPFELTSGMLRTSDSVYHCPIEAVAGVKGYVTAAHRLKLPTRLRNRIMKAADGFGLSSNGDLRLRALLLSAVRYGKAR
jgi:hypothetical protein